MAIRKDNVIIFFRHDLKGPSVKKNDRDIGLNDFMLYTDEMEYLGISVREVSFIIYINNVDNSYMRILKARGVVNLQGFDYAFPRKIINKGNPIINKFDLLDI